jgi:hypothetical protein
MPQTDEAGRLVGMLCTGTVSSEGRVESALTSPPSSAWELLSVGHVTERGRDEGHCSATWL